MATEKRLIDANEFEEAHCKGCPYRLEGSCTNDDPICATIADLRDAPTVDAVEVVHGRWIRRGNEMKCSRCLFIYYSNHDDFNYCPNCGAKMDGERKDNG